MGNPFDKFDYTPVEDRTRPAAASPPSNPFDAPDIGSYSTPVTPVPLPRGRANEPFGELKAYDPSPTQRFKNLIQDALMGVGAKPHVARHLAEGTHGLVSTFTPMGSILSGADLTYDVPRGNLGHAALDALGFIPGALAAKRVAEGVPQAVPALSAPSWIKREYPELERDFVTPSVPELVGRGPRYNEPVGTAQQAYAVTRNSPITYHPDFPTVFEAHAGQHLQTPGGGSFSPEGTQGVYSILRRFGSERETPNQPVTASYLDDMRQQLLNLEGKEGAAGRRAADLLDQYMTLPSGIVSGTPRDLAELRAAFTTARGDYRAGQTAKAVEGQIDYAGTRAGASHSGMNIENTTRQKLAGMTSPTSDVLQFARPEERNAVREVARTGGLASTPIPGAPPGTMTPAMPSSNRQRYVGNLLGGGGGVGQLGTAGFGGYLAGHLTGVLDPVTAAAIGVGVSTGTGVLGRAFKQAGNERAVQAAEAAADVIKRNSPEFQRRLAQYGTVSDPNAMTRDAIAYALLSPPARQVGAQEWDKLFVPYENRDQEQPPQRAPLQITVRPTVNSDTYDGGP